MPHNLSVQSAARRLGGEVFRGDTVLCPGQGHSPRDRSLSVRFALDAPGGFLVHSFAGDDPLQCRDYVRDRLGWPTFKQNCKKEGSKSGQIIKAGFSEPVTTALHQDNKSRATIVSNDAIIKPDNKHINYALRIWGESIPASGTLAETYCRARVASLPVEVFAADALSFHPACPFKNKATGETFRLPTMIALLRDVVMDAPRGIHRTALRPDGGGKADMPDGDDPKRMLGTAKGCAVKLSPDEEVTQGLAITEGIETGLSIYALGIRPVWCVGSAGNIQYFPVLEGIKSLTIYADHDTNHAGQRAAIACAKRWRDAGRECRIIQPKRSGADWNDIAQEAQYA